jgi:hypothetical protein
MRFHVLKAASMETTWRYNPEDNHLQTDSSSHRFTNKILYNHNAMQQRPSCDVDSSPAGKEIYAFYGPQFSLRYSK